MGLAELMVVIGGGVALTFGLIYLVLSRRSK
jgi:hypothetical protein